MRTISTERLRASTTEHELIALVRDYLSEWLPEELAALPIELRPGKLFDAADLNHFALELTRACVSFDVAPESLKAIEEMDAFIGQACRRMAEIGRPAQERLASRV